MTVATQQLALAAEKVSRWTAKHAHATAMLAKWKHQLTKLQGAKPVEPTINKVPALTLDDPKIVPITAKAKKPPTPPKKK